MALSPRSTRPSPRRRSTTSHGRLNRFFPSSLSAPPSTTASRRPSFTPATTSQFESTRDSPARSELSDGAEVSPLYHDSSLQFSMSREQSLSPAPSDSAKPRTYASLPPSPVSPVSPSLTPVWHQFRQQQPTASVPFSLWDYLREELLATDFDSHQELKWERVSNFLKIPTAIEKIISFGFILCFDSFLHTFTILPIRFALALWRLVTDPFKRTVSLLPPSQKADILRTLLLIISVSVLVPLTDASQIYHFIRGQDTIKLYVIFNALEIADRLCASIGQDIIDCLFSRSTLLLLSRRMPVTSHTLRPFIFFALATLYIVSHSLVLVYQLISLNVAVNSYDHALLTLLVSNQFVEIKGSVFKKFEKDNLFQITCADIVERFTLSLMLFAVAFRNLIELSGSEFDLTEGIVLPKSFGWFRDGNILWTISYPVLTVLVSEIFVDWLKHAFITKFNHIRPSVYERYTDVLCRDLSTGSAIGRRGARKHTYVDQSPIVARRLGFPSLPLAVVSILIGSQSISLMLSTHSVVDFSPLGFNLVQSVKWATLGVLFWLCFVVIKLIMGVNLVSYATRRRAGMEAREIEDAVNDFGRDPIGEGREEQKYNRELKELLDNKVDDASPTAEIGERDRSTHSNAAGVAGGKEGRSRLKLEELTRFTMVKRIW